MALEDVLKSLADSISANTVAVTKNTELLQSALAARGGAAAAPAATTASAPAAQAAAATASEPKRGPGRPPKAAAAAPKAPAEDDLRKAAQGFLKVEDADEKAARRDFIASMNEHFGVAKVLEIPEDRRAEALDFLKRKAAGEDVTFGEGGDENGEDALI